MLMSTPEVTALAQTLQPTLPLFNIIEGYRDIQSVEAVLEAQQSFQIDQNLGRFKGNPYLDIPDENERIRYLGFILIKSLDLARPLQIQLKFPSRFAWTPLILMLRAFGLQGKRQIRITQGLTLHQDTVVTGTGKASFDFEAFDTWIRYPERLTGFLLYLIRPSGPRQMPPEPTSVAAPAATGIVRSTPGLNVYRHIDTRA